MTFDRIVNAAAHRVHLMPLLASGQGDTKPYQGSDRSLTVTALIGCRELIELSIPDKTQCAQEKGGIPIEIRIRPCHLLYRWPRHLITADDPSVRSHVQIPRLLNTVEFGSSYVPGLM